MGNGLALNGGAGGAEGRSAGPEPAGWNGINILHSNASAVGALDLGIGRAKKGEAPWRSNAESAKFVYLQGADSLTSIAPLIHPDAFVVYTGSHGDLGASLADVVLPTPAYTEKSATYVNTEGRVQRTKAAVGRLAEAREDWQIVRALSELTGKPLPYQSLEQLRCRLVEVSPTFATTETLPPPTAQSRQGDQQTAAGEQKANTSGQSSASPSPSTPFVPLHSNYFFTDPISRSSATMAKCCSALPQSKNSYLDAQQQEVHDSPPQRQTPKQAPYTQGQDGGRTSAEAFA